jgi:hypothetical protein
MQMLRATRLSRRVIGPDPTVSNTPTTGTIGSHKKAVLTPAEQAIITRASLLEMERRFILKVCLIVSSEQQIRIFLEKTTSLPHSFRRSFKKLIASVPPLPDMLAHVPQLRMEIFFAFFKEYLISSLGFHLVSTISYTSFDLLQLL